MTFWGLLGEVAHIAQEPFLIGQFAEMNSFHWLKCPWQYLNQFELSQTQITTTYTSLHTHSLLLSDILYKSLGFSDKKHNSTCKITV